jgi:zinc finger SWIM domain-containing protein 3
MKLGSKFRWIVPIGNGGYWALLRIMPDTRMRLLINDNVGVRVNSSIKSSIVEAGGYENVTYNEKDVRNFLDKERRLKCWEGDGQALHDYFVRM